jgi:flagellar L-ring protein FlgH
MKRWILTVVATIGAAAPVGRADSIWDRRDPRYSNLFQDNRARNIGDLVTVTIAESTVTSNQDTRGMTKSTNATASVQVGPPTSTTGTGASPLFTVSSNRQFTGNAQLSQNRTFTDQMAATVVDMMPNGNLVIEGYRNVVIAGEERMLRISGVIRQQDIVYGNIIPSTSVANFRISYLGRGPESRFANQNYLSRLVNRIWPF